MAGIDAALLRYGITIITESGKKFKVDDAVTSLEWEEQEGQLAQRATFDLAAEGEIDGEKVKSIPKLNRIVRIFASWGEGKTKVFDGIIWEWQYSHNQQKQVTVTAYDPLIRLQQSRDIKYYSKGLTTKALLRKICGGWGIPLNYKWKKEITHSKKVFNNEAISDMITSILDEVRKKKDERYIAIYKDSKLEINEYGSNSPIYVFDETNTISTSDKLSMSELVTRVKIMSQADDKGRSRVEAVINGKTKFGILQEIVQHEADKNIGHARAEANTILDERGDPEETITVTTPDVPITRKGDAVKMKAANLKGMFFVLGVTHNATQRLMTMQLLRKKNL